MSYANVIRELEAKVQQYQQDISKSIVNHNGLIGALKGTMDALAMATKAANELLPGTPVDTVLNVADNVANVVDSSVENQSSTTA